MADAVADFFWKRLAEWGVKTIFGYPGDGINGLLGALQRNDLPFEFIQVRHEEMAAFMATAYAKFTGEVGVCLATSGPGATHLLTGMYDAYSDHVPLLAIAGQQARNVNGAHYQQELDLTSVYKDVAAYVQQAASPASVRHIVDRAMRIAKAERKGELGHYHHDLRFLFEADPAEPLVCSSESKDLAWVELERVTALNPEESMARMVRKTRQ